MLRKIFNELSVYSFSREDVNKVRPKVMAVNSKYVRIWSVVTGIYWTFCLAMTLVDPDYLRCRVIYTVALITCASALLISFLFGRKHPWLVWLTALMVELAILFPGVFIARELSPKTIIIFTSVLIVPVMFINDSLSTVVLLLLDILLFSVVGRRGMVPETYKWTLTNQIIFSSIGIMLGHFVNKERFERYVIAETAVQLAESNARLAQLQSWYARYDQMSGLQNRRAYAERIDRLREDMPSDGCVVMVDINGLKQTNDAFGHEAGDELIIGAAECLRQSFEGIDSIYRIGGDEFCVLLNGTEEFVEGCLKQLETISGSWNGKYVHGISLSCGYAMARAFDNLDSLLKAADQRMYAVKNEYYRTSGQYMGQD